MSMRKSLSADNLRNTTSKINKKVNKQSSMEKSSFKLSKGSDVGDLLSVSSVKSAKYAKGSSAKNIKPKKNDTVIAKQQSQSICVKSSAGKDLTKKPAWLMKHPFADTPRSECSAASSYQLPLRPSIEDFLDFQEPSNIEPTIDDVKIDTITSKSSKTLLEYLSVDTARSSNTSGVSDIPGEVPCRLMKKNEIHNSHVQTDRTDTDSSQCSQKRLLNKKKSRSRDFNQDEEEIKSWSSLTSIDNMKNRKPSTSKQNKSNFATSEKPLDNKVYTSVQTSVRNYKNTPKTSVLLSQQDLKESCAENKSDITLNCQSRYSKHEAAKVIQIWWRKSHIRQKASKAAFRRMMENKRKQLEKNIANVKQQEYEEYKKQIEQYEEIKVSEDEAREARQKIIDEMYMKRNSKSKHVEATLTSEKSGINNRKVVEKTSSKSSARNREQIVLRPDTASSIGRKVDEIFESSSRGSNSPRSTYVSDTNGHNDEKDPHGTMTVKTSVLSDVKSSKTTLDDLLKTLKELEDEPIGLEKNSSNEMWRSKNGTVSRSFLDGENMEIAPKYEDNYKAGSLLTADKLKTIMSFLDEVERVEDDVRSDVLSSVLQPQSVLDERLRIEDSLVTDSASQVASEISNAITAQKNEINEKSKTVELMKKAITQQKEFTTMQMKEMDKEHKAQLLLQRQEYESTIQRHLSFIDQLIDDKKVLTQRCEDLVIKLKDMDQKYGSKLKQLTETHSVELKKQKEISEAAEKLRREKWIKEKTQEIKEMTVKGLEPDIQKLIAKHKAEIKKIKAMKQGEVLEADERVGRKYIQQIEELRAELEREKELAIKKEKENARQRYEDQLRDEETSYQQQRRRLYAEVENEKERLNEHIEIMQREFDEKRSAYESSAKHTLTSAISDYEKQINEIKKSCEVEIRNYKEQVDIEKQQWIENYMKKQDTQLLAKERELKEGVRDARDKEIEMVIARLEQETALNREESERTAENRVKRIRDKYENEIKELEASEQIMHDKCHSLKERCETMENECIKLRSDTKQKQRELEDMQKISERLQQERGKVSDIIRQEFADRLVALEEESKRLRNELHEEKSRHRFSVERITKDKEEEMEEVHQRVKKAIAKKEETTQILRQQMQAAEKRAEHLEQLLAEQRKKILGK